MMSLLFQTDGDSCIVIFLFFTMNTVSEVIQFFLFLP